MTGSYSFKKSLDEEYNFPTKYNFKFIVATKEKNKVIDLLPKAKIAEKKSRNGKYTSLTMTSLMKNSSEILYIYEKASKIKGVISL